MVLKYRKAPIIRVYYPSSELNGHIFGLGRIGGGKSVSMKTIIEGYHNMGYKIWDMYGGERHEGIFWCFKSLDDDYWDKIKLVGAFDDEGPKQYKVNLLYPCFMNTLPDKLPYKEGFVTSKIFTIPLTDVTIEDIKDVLGTISDTSGYVWNEIVNKATKKDTCSVLEDLTKKFGGLNTLLYKNFILPIMREKFLMSSDCSTNLDLKGEADDKEAITVLCLDFVPEKFHLFVIDYILRKQADMIDENKIKKKNINFIREAATFFRVTDEATQDENLRIFRAKLSHYIRYGRRGQYFALDAQSYAEVKGLVQGSEDFLLLFKTTSYKDKEESTEILKREKRMRQDQINDLSFLKPGECYVVETGMKNVVKVKLILPRSAYWKKDYPNFYKSMWEKYGGDWKNVESIKDDIVNLCTANKDKYANEVMSKKERKDKAFPEEIENDYDQAIPDIPLVQIRQEPIRKQIPVDLSQFGGSYD